MALFFFNLVSGTGERTPDDVGLEFASLDDAYFDVFRAILDISFDMLKQRRDPSDYSFDITDAEGVVVLQIPFSEALRPGRNSQLPVSPDCFIEDMRAHLQRHRQLRADLMSQLSKARRTVETTRLLLVRSRAVVA